MPHRNTVSSIPIVAAEAVMSVSVSCQHRSCRHGQRYGCRPCRVQIQARQAIGLFDELIAAAGGRLDREAIDAGADRVRRAAEVFGRSIVQRDNKLAAMMSAEPSVSETAPAVTFSVMLPVPA